MGHGIPRCLRLVLVGATLMVLLPACGTRVRQGPVTAPTSGHPQPVDARLEHGSSREGENADGGEHRIGASVEHRATSSTAPKSLATTGPMAVPPGVPSGTAIPPAAATRPVNASGSGEAPRGVPIRLGNIGNYSGPVGSSLAGGRSAIQAWVRWVNEREAIAGHPVELVTADDGSDPARNLALTRDMVENQKVVAFIANAIPISAGGARTYLEERRIPVVGGDLIDEIWEGSKMFFPQGTPAGPLFEGIAKTGALTGKRKLGMFYCAEATACRRAYDVMFTGGAAARAGLEPVYAAQISVAQPDFTAECLQAQSRGVEILAIGADTNTVRRIGDSCGRQGYRPQWLSGSMTTSADLVEDRDLDNLMLVVPTFPFTLEGCAATEYHAALARHAANLTLSAATSAMWTAGKLFERAVGRTATPGRDVTTEDVLAGLWSIRDETLDGLAPPLSYVVDRPTPPPPCYFVVQSRGGRWAPMNDGKYLC